MSVYIQRELSRITSALNKTTLDTPAWRELHVAQQALSWALDPIAFKSPVDMLLGVSEVGKMPKHEAAQ